MDYGALLGAAGSIATGILNADAISGATKLQTNALQQVIHDIQAQMSPDTLQSIATKGDTERATAQQALLAKIYPGLAAAQTAAEKSLAEQAGGFGPQSLASQVGAKAAQEALSAPSTTGGQQQLIDSALAQLKAGATLPPDVEAQLVQAGLESSGMVTQHASGQGVGGQQLRTILGTAGLNLQMQRQQQAASLLTQAQDLETKRQNVLQSLFPNLSQVQLQQAGGAQSIFGTTANATPQAGLSGASLANAWLQRLGATNQATEQLAGIKASGKLAAAQNWSNTIGGITGSGSQMLGGGKGGGGGGGGGGSSALTMNILGQGLG